MEYQKIVNLLDNTPKQPSKFRTKNWVEINDGSKGILIPLGLTSAAPATDAAIHKKIFESGNTTLTISNEEMNDIMKIIKSLEGSDLLAKNASKTIKNEAKEQKGVFLSTLLGTLGGSLLGNLLAGKRHN